MQTLPPTTNDEPLPEPAESPRLPDPVETTLLPPAPMTPAPGTFAATAGTVEAARRRRMAQRALRDGDRATGLMVVASVLALTALIGGLLWWATDDGEQAAGDTDTVVVESADVIVLDDAVLDGMVEPSEQPVAQTPAAPPSGELDVTVTDGETLATGATPDPIDPAPPASSVPAVEPPVTTLVMPPAEPATTAPPETTPASTEPPTVEVAPSTVEAIDANPSLGRFMTLLQDNVFLVEIDEAADVTVFAPTDAAIEAFAETEEGAAVFADPYATREFLLRHIVWQRLDSAAVMSAGTITMANGEVLVIDAGAATIAGARLVEADTETTQGFVHTLDGLLLPPA